MKHPVVGILFIVGGLMCAATLVLATRGIFANTSLPFQVGACIGIGAIGLSPIAFIIKSELEDRRNQERRGRCQQIEQKD